MEQGILLFLEMFCLGPSPSPILALTPYLFHFLYSLLIPIYLFLFQLSFPIILLFMLIHCRLVEHHFNLPVGVWSTVP